MAYDPKTPIAVTDTVASTDRVDLDADAEPDDLRAAGLEYVGDYDEVSS